MLARMPLPLLAEDVLKEWNCPEVVGEEDEDEK
jgi:hypothetical protein